MHKIEMMNRQRIRKGITIVTFLVFPAVFFYMSPYLSIMGAVMGIISGSLLFFGLLFLISLVLGRAYCGWVCPASLIQDNIASVNSKPITRGKYIKWLIWIPWVISIILLLFKAGGIKQVNPLFMTVKGLSIGDIYGLFTYFGVLTLITLPAFIIGKRSFCHHICWMSQFMIIGRKISVWLKLPSLRLRSTPEKCNNCGKCTTECPMSLNVNQMVAAKSMENPDCILCGNCVDGCKLKAIKYSFPK